MNLKNISNVVKLRIMPNKAIAKPPISSVLGQKGINIMKFCKEFNKITKTNISKLKLRVIVKIFKDKSFTIDIKEPTTVDLLKEKLNIKKGSSNPKRLIIAKINEDQIIEISRLKMNDMILNDKTRAIKNILGTMKSMGIEIIKKKI